MAKIDFIYKIEVSDDLPKLALVSLRSAMRVLNVGLLAEKASPALRQVKIDVGDIPTRVHYSPLDGIITVNPKKDKMRHKSQGLVINTLFALSMAYYDHGLKNKDRLYWKQLTRNKKPDQRFLAKASFSVGSTGKSRLFFASELVKHLMLDFDSELIVEFFSPEVPQLVTLSRTRFKGLVPRRELNEPIAIQRTMLDEELIPLKDALDLSGITGITDILREKGLKFEFDYDSTGMVVFNARTRSGQTVVQIKRSFIDGYVKNDYFSLDPSLQRKGLGLKLFASQLMTAVNMGITHIKLKADRDDANGLSGYDVWWKFGFDGVVEASKVGGQQAKSFWREAVISKILNYSPMDLQVKFYGMMQRLEQKVDEAEFSPMAYQYLLDVTLDGNYQDLEDFQDPSMKDFMTLVDFFNRMSPRSRFLENEGLSYERQRIQRLMELEGFEAFWTRSGVAWSAELDLSEGASSPSVGILKNYLEQRDLL